MGAMIYNMLTGAFPYPFSKERDPIDVILNDDVVPVRKRDRTFGQRLRTFATRHSRIIQRIACKLSPNSCGR